MERKRDYKKERDTTIANKAKIEQENKGRIELEKNKAIEEKEAKIRELVQKIDNMKFDENGNLVQ